MKGSILAFPLTLLILTSIPATAKNNLSPNATLPHSLIGLFMVYDSGSITSFEQKTLWMFSVINEYYVYHRKGITGYISRIKYSHNGTIRTNDILNGEEFQNLVSSNSIYKRCNNTILKPVVDYTITPIKDHKTGMYYTDRWNVKQKSKVCKNINVRHHASDDSCETNCIEYYPGYLPALKNMRLYKSKDAALADSRSR